MYSQHYDSDKEWEDDKPGWLEVTIYNASNKNIPEILFWTYENVDKPERHMRWKTIDDTVRFKFRYERDYIMFTLRWS